MAVKAREHIDMESSKRRILFIDAFDSFTNNIIGLLEQSLDVSVTEVHINDTHTAKNLSSIIKGFDAVVVGPGPGHPANPVDVGFIDKLWKLSDEEVLPVLGVCLGFQSLCYNFGAGIKELAQARHGIVSKLTHKLDDIFGGITSDLETTQYHSLHVDLGLGPEGVQWAPSDACPELQPLAWDQMDEINGPVLMGVRHITKPLWGVQFHPESICTSEAGKELIVSWWKEATKWSEKAGRVVGSMPQAMPLRVGDYNRGLINGNDKPNGHAVSSLPKELRSMIGGADVSLSWNVVAANISPVDVVQQLSLNSDEVVLLDSQGHARGRYSIVGLVNPRETMKVTYRVSDQTLRYGFQAAETCITKLSSIDQVWPIFREALGLHDPQGRGATQQNARAGVPEDSPFWGGFMGYISYEAGLETIDVDLHESCATGGVPDINFAFIHRSIIIDHQESQVYVQSLLPEDWSWITKVTEHISSVASNPPVNDAAENEATLATMLRNIQVNRPEEDDYRKKVLRCQDFLAHGDSYELCLTDETEIKVPQSNNLDPWTLYKQLRRKNSAPMGAYVNLADVTVVGSSPERFLRWTRDGRCQFRPIKGTVKKGPDMSREQAHAILGSSKERAENLMIVDLIRHDLCGVVGADRSWVSKLMVVEEYETVYQLVSVIEGQLPPKEENGAKGMDVLKASLPPGSMTGAPKKRSCEILRDMEKRPRGIYSGVLGYMEVGGAGDFSVVIRTAVRNAALSTGGKEMWRVGAGGAVTIQSTDEGEFVEMETKASSVLGALLPRDVA